MIYLIDFENVHEEGFSSLGKLGDKDAVYCFFTKNVAKISMSALAGIRSGQLHFVEAESGKQSLDLALVSFLGYLIGTRPQEQCFEIVSNDNGFQKAADFWNKRGNGLRVRVRKTVPQAAPSAGSAHAPVQQMSDRPAAENLRENNARENESKEPKQQQVSDHAAKPAAVPEAKSIDPAVLSALSAAGIGQAQAEFLQTQVEKYRSDKNVKQLVYRAVVKKYGQKAGTQIYNSAKKIMLK